MKIGIRKRLKLTLVFTMLICVAVALFVLASSHRSQVVKSYCRNNLAQIGLALHWHEDSKGRFPTNAAGWSWFVESMPFIEGNPPFFRDLSKPWDDPTNRDRLQHDKQTGEDLPVKSDECRIFVCPRARARFNEDGYGLTSYVGVGGLGPDAPHLPADDPQAGFFGEREGTRIDQIRDGLAATMAVIETARENGPWRAPGPSTIRGLDPGHQPYVGKGRQFGGLHREGALVLFADGTVRIVSEKVNPAVFEAMSTIAGGEKVGDLPQLALPTR